MASQDHEATARELYEIQEIEDKSTTLGIHYRITEIGTDSRVATCYLPENAGLVCDALNGNIRALAAAEAKGAEGVTPAWYQGLARDLTNALEKRNAEISQLKAERDEQRKLLDGNVVIFDEYIHEIHKLEGELEYARGGPSKNDQWKKLVAVRDAALAQVEELKEQLGLKTQLDQLDKEHEISIEKAVKAARIEGIRAAKEVCKPWLKCECDLAYTSRGRHETMAAHLIVEEIADSIAALIEKEKSKDG